MSVAEITISYIARPSLDAFGRIKEQKFDFSSQRKKAVLKFSVFSFVFFIALYLYLAGAIVSLNFNERDLKERLDYALISANEREAEFVKSAYAQNSDFFANKGFERPLLVEIIKRSLNVAEIQNAQNLY